MVVIDRFHCISIWVKLLRYVLIMIFTYTEKILIKSLTHWGRVTHICVGKLTIICSDNGLSPERRQVIIWTNAEILLIGPLETNFSEISIGIQTFSFKKMHLKMSSAKWRPFCLGLNVLTYTCVCVYIRRQYWNKCKYKDLRFPMIRTYTARNAMWCRFYTYHMVCILYIYIYIYLSINLE